MFGFFGLGLDAHLIDHGRVACPASGADVELDRCAACRWLVEMKDHGETRYVRCRPEPTVDWRRIHL